MQDKRLLALLDEVGYCNTLADVGTDHGLLPLSALKGGRAKRVIATDVSQKSLQKAINLLTEEGYEESSIFRCGDGFTVLEKGEADVIVVSGMGGIEISKMIESAEGFSSKLVLSPQSEVERVRRTLISCGYEIVSDRKILSSKKFYDIITAMKGKGDYTEIEYELGRGNLEGKSPDFWVWLDMEIQKADNLSRTVGSSSASEGFKQRADKLRLIKRKYLEDR